MRDPIIQPIGRGVNNKTTKVLNEEIAFEIASCFGSCIVTDKLKIASLKKLKDDHIVMACSYIIANVPRWRQSLDNLASDGGYDDVLICHIQQRYKLWTADIGLLYGGNKSSSVSKLIDHAKKEIDMYDRLMRHYLDWFSTIHDHEEIEKQRSVLVDPWKTNPPWWLDGVTLPTESKRINDEVGFDTTYNFVQIVREKTKEILAKIMAEKSK